MRLRNPHGSVLMVGEDSIWNALPEEVREHIDTDEIEESIGWILFEDWVKYVNIV